MEFLVRMAGECQRGQAAFPCVDAQFFLQFADQGLFWGFAGLDLAAGKFPQACHALSFGALGQKDATIHVNKGDGGYKNCWDAHDR